MAWRDDIDEDGDLFDRDDPDESDMDDSDDPELTACPFCGKSVSEESERCHHCGNYVSVENARGRTPWWLILGMALAGVVVLTWMLR